jgi:hypothetical protein
MLQFSGAGTVSGGASIYEIVVTTNAEIERNGQDLLGSSAVIDSGVGGAGAHGRVFRTSSSPVSYNYPSTEFVSAGVRFYVRADSAGNILWHREDTSRSHIRVSRNASDLWEIVGDAGLLATGSTSLPIETWFDVMLYARIHNSAGEYAAKLFNDSGALIETLSGSGVDTYGGIVDLAKLTTAGSLTSYADHFWVDLSGNFRGCGFVETRRATANGDTNSWTRGGTDTGNNWDQIDEVPKDETSHVFSTGADQIELYTYQDKSQAGDLIAVHQIVYAIAHTAGTREWKPICKIGATIYEGATQSTTSTNVNSAPVLIGWINDPSTGSAWTDSGYNAAQFGTKSVTTDVRLQNCAMQLLIDIET